MPRPTVIKVPATGDPVQIPLSGATSVTVVNLDNGITITLCADNKFVQNTTWPLPPNLSAPQEGMNNLWAKNVNPIDQDVELLVIPGNVSVGLAGNQNATELINTQQIVGPTAGPTNIEVVPANNASYLYVIVTGTPTAPVPTLEGNNTGFLGGAYTPVVVPTTVGQFNIYYFPIFLGVDDAFQLSIPTLLPGNNAQIWWGNGYGTLDPLLTASASGGGGGNVTIVGPLPLPVNALNRQFSFGQFTVTSVAKIISLASIAFPSGFTRENFKSFSIAIDNTTQSPFKVELISNTGGTPATLAEAIGMNTIILPFMWGDVINDNSAFIRITNLLYSSNITCELILSLDAEATYAKIQGMERGSGLFVQGTPTTWEDETGHSYPIKNNPVGGLQLATAVIINANDTLIGSGPAAGQMFVLHSVIISGGASGQQFDLTDGAGGRLAVLFPKVQNNWNLNGKILVGAQSIHGQLLPFTTSLSVFVYYDILQSTGLIFD